MSPEAAKSVETPSIINQAEALRETVIQAKSTAREAARDATHKAQEYEQELRTLLVGKKVRITGHLETEEFSGQDGSEWDRSHTYLTNQEATVDQVWVENEDTPEVFITMTKGTGINWGRGMIHLFGVRSIEIISDEGPSVIEKIGSKIVSIVKRT